MARYYGSRRWCYRFCGRYTDWPNHDVLPAGNLDLGTNCGWGYENDRRYARHLLRQLLGIKRLPSGVQVFPFDHHLYGDRAT